MPSGGSLPGWRVDVHRPGLRNRVRMSYGLEHRSRPTRARSASALPQRVRAPCWLLNRDSAYYPDVARPLVEDDRPQAHSLTTLAKGRNR
jgi:hypothetical protein